MRNNQGFTLIELMIVVVIVAILASIAVPAYQNQVLKTGRTDGKSALMSAAQRMERCFTANSTYVGCTIPATSDEGLYTLGGAGGATATSFTLTATPTVGRGQVRDTECATLSITQAGVRGISGTGSVDNCW